MSVLARRSVRPNTQQAHVFWAYHSYNNRARRKTTLLCALEAQKAHWRIPKFGSMTKGPHELSQGAISTYLSRVGSACGLRPDRIG